jgi:hypothetical protein
VRGDMQLFGGHTVNTIEDKIWIKIPLHNFQTLSKQEVKNIELLTEYPLEGLHYYCETIDLTRTFPSINKVIDYDEEYCWNHWLSLPFQIIGLRSWCVVLLQGMAISKSLPKYLNMGLITKKSNINPGTRYYARGLNDKGGVGNEMECELIMWSSLQENSIRWFSYYWRRGT